MVEGDKEGIEILDGAVSTTSSAPTHRLDKNDLHIDDRSTLKDAASRAEGGGSSRRHDDPSLQLDKLEAPGDDDAKRIEIKMEARIEESLPFDEDSAVASAVPLRHVASYPLHGGGDRADDVSSLQHTNMEGKSSYYQTGKRPEGALSEEEAGYQPDEGYCENDEEQQRALQRRNVLIVVMLVFFVGLVAAIATGLGLAVKDSPKNNADGAANGDEGAPRAGEGTTDDEYDGLGGGVDSDDRFATSVPSSSPSEEGRCIPVEVGIIFDEYSGETGWKLVQGEYDPEEPSNNRIAWKSKYYKPSEYSKRADTFRKCFREGEYTFVFADKEKDGVCCNHGKGLYVLSSEGKTIAVGGEMQSEEDITRFKLPFIEPEPADEDGDGLDDRLGLIMPYDSSGMTEGVDCENFRLEIRTDTFGLETTWGLFEGKDRSGTLIANGGPYGSEHTQVIEYCLASPGEYSLYMYDWDGRGLCCEYGEGWYSVSSGDVVIVDRSGEFGYENMTRFVLPAGRSVTPIKESLVLGPAMLPVSGAPTAPPVLWSVLIPSMKKTSYPTVNPEAPSVSLTRSPSTLTKLRTHSPAALPTAPPTRSDLLDVPVIDKELTPFPTLSLQDDKGG